MVVIGLLLTKLMENGVKLMFYADDPPQLSQRLTIGFAIKKVNSLKVMLRLTIWKKYNTES